MAATSYIVKSASLPQTLRKKGRHPFLAIKQRGWGVSDVAGSGCRWCLRKQLMMRNRRSTTAWLPLVVLLAASTSLPLRASESLPLRDIDADPAIPTLQKVLGHDWAQKITSHAQVARYLQALSSAAPRRCRVVRYGSSTEGRGLCYVVIAKPENIDRIDQVRQRNLQLSDPRRTSSAEAQEIAGSAPAVVWLAASVHGNELSGTEAMLLTAYHLLADRREETSGLLDQMVVLIDPLQNPDGRERFVNVNREMRGVFVDPHHLSAEHTERWPGGRSNHYFFDMNRDWFLQSQLETRHKVNAYLQWQPQIYVDAHEMGRNSTYYFVPPTDPINPFLAPRQEQWLYDLGRNHAEWYDKFGFAYTTREIFDAFYAGYGSEWPTLQGGLGILWEQAGTRGLIVHRDDETRLRYQDAVLHHYVSCLATLNLVAQRREDLLLDFYDTRSQAVRLGSEGPVQSFFLLPGTDPSRTRRLAEVLRRNGIELHQLNKPLQVQGQDIRGGKKGNRRVPVGSYHIPVAQPTANLIRSLLDKTVAMDQEYIEQQLQRQADYLPDQIYDVTAWSLPLAFDVPCLSTGQPVVPKGPVWDGKTGPAAKPLEEAKVAYLVRPGDAAIEALCLWLRQGLRVHVMDEGFTLDDKQYPRGTLLLKKQDNPEALHEMIRPVAERLRLTVEPANTGFVTEGAHFGGPHARWVRRPRICLLIDSPASYSVGHTWYMLDQVWKYPATRVGFSHLSRLDLDDFNVLIMPHGSYDGDLAPGERMVSKLKQWVRDGGTLILVKGAASWAAGEAVGLLAAERVMKPLDKDAGDKPEAESSSETAKQPPESVPGAFLRANVFTKHWLTFGCPEQMHVMFNGNLLFEPPAPTKARSLVTFAQQDQLLSSGFCWPETLELAAGKMYMSYQSSGEGHIVAFADDPNYRAMYPGLQRLFINAVLFGPGH